MFKATTQSNEIFHAWVKDSATYQALDDATKVLVRSAFALGWNSVFGSFLPANSQADIAFALSQEISGLLGELSNEPDRSVAIIGCSFVDEALQIAIASAMVNDEDVRSFVENTRLSYFVRCELAFGLGFFRKESLADLHLLGTIRNRFAHRRTIKSFSDPDIQRYCARLEAVKHIQGWTATDPRQVFMTTIALISVYLTHRARSEPERLSWGNLWEPE
jgi:DNA-binding MltR family transcriptional regulator